MDHKCPSCHFPVKEKNLVKKEIDVPKDHEDYGVEMAICPKCHAELAAKKYLSEFVLLVFLTLTLLLSIFHIFIPLLKDLSPYPTLLMVIALLIHSVWPVVGLRNRPKWEIYE